MTQQAVRPGADAPLVHQGSQTTKKLPWPVHFYKTAVGKKWVMAISGIGFMGFVLAHMVGNLKLYLGPEDTDKYAKSLRTLLYPILPKEAVLWGMRIGLILMLLIHIHAAFSLTRLNRASRPVNYQSKRDYIAADWASRTMRLSGVFLGLYVLFHIADLTIGTANPGFEAHHVYHNVVASFERVPIAVLYIVANAALAFHLYHGAWSIFQSLGLNNPKYNSARRIFAAGFAGAIGIINCLFPVMVLLGVISESA